MTVSRRSRTLGRVRLLITPGTLHPKPRSKGTILLPERPSFLSGRSITKAIRAMYPLSSIRDRKKKSSNIKGRNTITVPTPPYMPSMMRLCMMGAMLMEVRKESVKSVIFSIPTSICSCIHAPMPSNVNQNTTAIMRMNEGMAVHLPVRILSMN